jgi:hypothetical protein
VAASRFLSFAALTSESTWRPENQTLLLVVGILEPAPIGLLGHGAKAGSPGDDEIVVFCGETFQDTLRQLQFVAHELFDGTIASGLCEGGGEAHTEDNRQQQELCFHRQTLQYNGRMFSTMVGGSAPLFANS